MEIKDRLAIFESMKADRSNWDTQWQTVAEYVDVRKANFTFTKEHGTFLNTDLFDNTAQLALNSRSSTLTSLLWDNGKFSYKPNDKLFDDSTDNNDWFQYVINVVKEEFAKAEANRVFFESEMDEGAFGSSYTYLADNNGDGLIITLFQVKECYVNETINSKVDTVYRNYQLSVKQAVDTFGLENVSEKTRMKYNNNKLNENVNILHIIQPRKNRDASLLGKDNMPIESVYIDLESKVEMKKQGVQGGFEYIPVFTSRESKKNGERYGRSSSMMAISDISQLNKVREDQIIIINRMALPAIGYDPESLQGNILDTSPGSSTPFRLSGRVRNPLFDMVPTKGDINATEVAILRLQESINSFYGIDRLLDFNNDTQMTLGESQIRAQIRQQSLGSLLSKKRSEKYEPLVKRAFAILFEQGKFGFMPNDPRVQFEEAIGKEPRIIPEDIVAMLEEGNDIMDLIDIEFYTQFEIEKKLLDNNTILQVWNNAGLLSQLTDSREVLDNLDYDKTIKAIGNVSVNVDIFKDKDEVAAIRAQRKQQQQIENALVAGKETSEIAKNDRQQA